MPPLTDLAVRRLFVHVDNFPMSVRLWRALKALGIERVGDLVTKQPSDLLALRNVGTKTVREVEEQLARYDLAMGMRLPAWPPKRDAVFPNGTPYRTSLDLGGGEAETDCYDVKILRKVLGLPKKRGA